MLDLVIVNPPRPPGSRTLLSPTAAVFETAPAKVLHGAVRLHGLASSPTPETQVRVAWAEAIADIKNIAARAPSSLFVFMSAPLSPDLHPSCLSRFPAVRRLRRGESIRSAPLTSSTAFPPRSGQEATRRATPPGGSTAERVFRCRSGREGAGAAKS